MKDDEGWFSTSFPEGVDELYFQVVGVIKDVEQLKSLYSCSQKSCITCATSGRPTRTIRN